MLCEAVQTPPVPMDSVGNVSVSPPPCVLYLLELCVCQVLELIRQPELPVLCVLHWVFVLEPSDASLKCCLLLKLFWERQLSTVANAVLLPRDLFRSKLV